MFLQKAKADNRYFAAMRAKDGLDAETKTAQKTVDRQNKLLEKAQEVERNLQAQVVAQEQAITKLKTTMTDLKKQSIAASSEKTALEHQLQHAQKHLAEVGPLAVPSRLTIPLTRVSRLSRLCTSV